jgi:Mg2+ and Co2+ transporter CorA
MSDITHEFSTTIAQRQSEQITRLTLISTIFLPVTALSGIFGMNFEWMTNAIAGGKAFFALGVLLPIASVAVSVGWLGRLGLLRFLFRR